MDDERRDTTFRTFISSFEGEGCAVDVSRIFPGITTFLVRSFDGEALQFSFPLVILRGSQKSGSILQDRMVQRVS
ncbi:MAG: hypothetical protein M0Q92_14930 [Methanoregula sp.]|jgi:hypothetical protein|nr:hypothetical protein [Methanoregula sp.]